MKFRFIDTIQSCTADDWNNLWRYTCPDRYPFLRYEFLQALEASGSVGNSSGYDSGWQPHHLIIEDGGVIIAALPLYIKSHSYGEYVFDWAWADAYQRCGLDYYPKLINAVPFTPSTGARLLHSAEYSPQSLWPIIAEALQSECQNLNASGWHSLFLPKAESLQLQALDTAQRLGCQFQWCNRDYQCFDDFLDQMSSRKRKVIRKERRRIAEQGIVFRTKSGAEICPQDWQDFYRFYQLTYSKLSGHGGYLSEEFFQYLGQAMSSSTLLVCAYNKTGQLIAAALNLFSSDTLFGRYWGCLQEYDFLHFETCYYRGIDFAIAKGLSRFDAGAQGEHKICRGFEPVLTHSNHSITEPRFKLAIDEFVSREAEDIQQYQQHCRGKLPFKATNCQSD